ncbi:predicted protein [Lodderomyces elongisporus NRRL YB-4239]|uniref:Uncharacterized protein n=1 Tax=Lodderomyces elongisporus (strain ATCC 11503 / CBS 2605 / JCM 1781 / NBRC 1676 / NRRL YB-4239) TaxID=379508 RepID=A5E0J9_LODEL|nr:predicted protein [Lodderomyces elongisporus NRRL YB-4239]
MSHIPPFGQIRFMLLIIHSVFIKANLARHNRRLKSGIKYPTSFAIWTISKHRALCRCWPQLTVIQTLWYSSKANAFKSHLIFASYLHKISGTQICPFYTQCDVIHHYLSKLRQPSFSIQKESHPFKIFIRLIFFPKMFLGFTINNLARRFQTKS